MSQKIESLVGKKLDELSFNELYVNDTESWFLKILIRSIRKMLMRHQKEASIRRDVWSTIVSTE